MSDMADVLREHELAIDYAEYFACTCGTIQDTTNGHHPEHVAAALSAAGFGPVQEAEYEWGWMSGTVIYKALDETSARRYATFPDKYPRKAIRRIKAGPWEDT